MGEREFHAARVPRSEDASIDERKLTQYLLNPAHPRGSGKARAFALLGYTSENWHALEQELLSKLPYAPGRLDRSYGAYGEGWEAVLTIEGPEASRNIRTIWRIREAGAAPRFVTAYPEE